MASKIPLKTNSSKIPPAKSLTSSKPLNSPTTKQNKNLSPALPQTKPSSPISQKSPPEKKDESKTVEDSGLINSLLFLKENKLIKDKETTIKFSSTKEAEDSAKEDVVLSIKDTLTTLKQDISELQKKGYELKLDGIKLLSVPIKVRVWKSTTSRKDLEAIFNLIWNVKSKIDPLKKLQEQRGAEKERLEKEKEKQEKLAREQKENAILKEKVVPPTQKQIKKTPQVLKSSKGLPKQNLKPSLIQKKTQPVAQKPVQKQNPSEKNTL